MVEKCEKCGQELKEGAKFCQECGNEVSSFIDKPLKI